MADIVRVVRLKDLEQLDFTTAVEQESIEDGDLTLVSHDNDEGKDQPKKVTLAAIRDYLVNYLKTSGVLNFEDLGDGEEIMEETINKIQIDSFTDKVYSMTKQYKLVFDSTDVNPKIGDYWTSEEIQIEEDCTAHIHADISLSGAARVATDNDLLEIQIKDQKGQWVTLCSQPRLGNAGILELDYHAKFQAGCIIRIASSVHGTTTKLASSTAFNAADSFIYVTCFSNDTPFIESIVSRYFALGQNKSPLLSSITSPFVADKPGIVWFNGTYTQGTNMLCTGNWLVNLRPYHTPTVYAQAISPAPNNTVSSMYLGNTENVIPCASGTKTEFDFNQLYHYINASPDNLVSITLSVDTMMQDQNKKSVFNGMYNPTKVTYCTQLSDLVSRINLMEGTEIYELSDVQDCFQSSDKVLATIGFAPGKPFIRYFNKDKNGKAVEATGAAPDYTGGSQRFNRAHVNVITKGMNAPYYVRYGAKKFSQEETDRNYSYAFATQDDKNLGLDFIIKNPYVAPIYQIPSANLTSQDNINRIHNEFDCETWEELSAGIETTIGKDPTKSLGAMDFKIQILSDNVDSIGICPFKVDDYAAKPIKIGDNIKSNPVDKYGDYSNRLISVEFNDKIPFNLTDSAFAFSQNIKSVEIPPSCTFSGDHTFRMGFGYTNPASGPLNGAVSKLLSASPYNSYIVERRPTVNPPVGTSEGQVVTAWYKAVNYGVKSELTSVMFNNANQASANIYPGEDRVHLAGDRILRNTFVNCSKLLSTNIQATDAAALSGTFINCEELQEVVIPDTCLSIKNRAFYGALGLKRVYFPTTLEDVDANVADCSRFEWARTLNGTGKGSLLWQHTVGSKQDNKWIANKLLSAASLSTNSGNGYLSSVGADYSNRNYGKDLTAFYPNEYEIVITLSGDEDKYYQDGTTHTAKISAEISSVVEALNKNYNRFSGLLWFPLVRVGYNTSKQTYSYSYLPPFGHLFYIADRNGKYIKHKNSNGKPMVYDSMIRIRDYDIRQALRNCASQSPNKSNACFVYDRWYTFGSGDWFRTVLEKTVSVPGQQEKMYQFNPGFLSCYYGEDEVFDERGDNRRYKPFTMKF